MGTILVVEMGIGRRIRIHFFITLVVVSVEFYRLGLQGSVIPNQFNHPNIIPNRWICKVVDKILGWRPMSLHGCLHSITYLNYEVTANSKIYRKVRGIDFLYPSENVRKMHQIASWFKFNDWLCK